MSRFLGEGPRRLLIVENENDLRKDMVAFFELKGYEVTDLGTAMEAVRRLESGQEWDYLITDISMPGMNGSDLLNWCCIWKKTFRTKVLLAGNPPTRLKNEKFIKDYGAIILNKPIALNELHRILEEGERAQIA